MKLINRNFNKTDFNLSDNLNDYYVRNNEKCIVETNKIEYICYLLTLSKEQTITSNKNKLKRIPSLIRDFIINKLFIN